MIVNYWPLGTGSSDWGTPVEEHYNWIIDHCLLVHQTEEPLSRKNVIEFLTIGYWFTLWRSLSRTIVIELLTIGFWFIRLKIPCRGRMLYNYWPLGTGSPNWRTPVEEDCNWIIDHWVLIHSIEVTLSKNIVIDLLTIAYWFPGIRTPVKEECNWIIDHWVLRFHRLRSPCRGEL